MDFTLIEATIIYLGMGTILVAQRIPKYRSVAMAALLTWFPVALGYGITIVAGWRDP